MNATNTQDQSKDDGCQELFVPIVEPFPKEQTDCETNEWKAACEKCCCPAPPSGNGFKCLKDLIKDQEEASSVGEAAKEAAKMLLGLQDKAVKARGGYTKAKHKTLRETWANQDKVIVDLIARIVCSVPQWECVLDCRLCRRLHDIGRLERQLYGGSAKEDFHERVHTQQELVWWHERHVEYRHREFVRINAVLDAWLDPAKTLEAALEANKKSLEDVAKTLAVDPANALYQMFVRVLPTHDAMDPRDGTGPNAPYASEVDRKYHALCPCDTGISDTCCGIETGTLSVRLRLNRVLPHLIDPDRLETLICCLIEKRYIPASQKLGSAKATLEGARNELARVKQQIDELTKSVEADFRAELTASTNWAKFRPRKDDKDDCDDTNDNDDDKPCGCRD